MSETPSPPVPPESPSGDVYAVFIKSLLDHEEARRSSLEARAAAVVTSSGVLVTLLFGVAAVITKSASFRLPPDSRVWLGAAVVMFVIATGIAIVMPVMPFPDASAVVQPDKLRQLWGQPAVDALTNVAQAQLMLVSAARHTNAARARLLFFASFAEVLALVTLAVAVILIIA